MEDDVQPRNLFFTNVEARFDSFKERVQRNARKQKLAFDEDVFMDTIIRCMNTFSNENASNEDVDKYFWVAYKQNFISSNQRNRFKGLVFLDAMPDVFAEDVYDSDLDVMMSMIENEVRGEFGDDIYELWYKHMCENKTYKQLASDEYSVEFLHNEFRQIKRHITGKFMKKNPEFARLVKENNLS